MKKTESIDNDVNSILEEKTFKFEKYKFKIDLFKWFIGSVALVIVTMIIERGFKERTTGIQEIQVYDKYVEVILKADNIEERWKLSEYFSIVTPTERLRERWIAYKDSIKIEYKKFKVLKEMEYELLKEKKASQVEDTLSIIDKKINIIQREIKPFENKLKSSNDYNSALAWEEKGFYYLSIKDVENAISSFKNSENADNGFNQVYEIHKYLLENKSKLENKDSKYWKTVYLKIADDFSYKMPEDIKTKFLKNSKENQ